MLHTIVVATSDGHLTIIFTMSNDQYCVNNTQLCQRAAGHDLLTGARCYCAAFNGKLFNHVSMWRGSNSKISSWTNNLGGAVHNCVLSYSISDMCITGNPKCPQTKQTTRATTLEGVCGKNATSKVGTIFSATCHIP